MYVKFYSDSLDSSLWAESGDTCKVWLTLLALADQDGMVRAAMPGIAHRARINEELTAKALAIFEAPDVNSRSTAHEGRRIERVDGGYLILNYIARRGIRNEEERREYMKDWMRKKRAAVSTVLTQLTHVEGEAEAKAEVETTTQKVESTTPPPYAEIQTTWNENAAKLKLPQCRDMTDKRRVAIRNRWTNKAWRKDWQAALGKIKDRPFLLGAGNRGWQIDIDKFLSPDTVTHIMEGKYTDNKPPPGSEAARHTAGSEARRDAEKLAARIGEPPPPPHPLIARLRELMKATNSATLTAIDGGTEWRAYAIDKETVFLDALVEGKSVQKRVNADSLTQFKELL